MLLAVDALYLIFVVCAVFWYGLVVLAVACVQ
ncbi:Protein of unknown function [Anaplasma phagocytophilum]|uniref:Uncharacterized protein n=2 Tax=Anaplasma phagocytophilum TaxID=948 RepID=A0A098EIE3_ANAPH|nr:Protein of unknown function [Anaplasma phagocytophilum]